jgi:hypothetical protein
MMNTDSNGEYDDYDDNTTMIHGDIYENDQ